MIVHPRLLIRAALAVVLLAVVRPQLFSLMAFALLVSLLAGQGATLRRLLPIPLLFTSWVNLHGGWIVGEGVLAMWAVLTALGSASRLEKAGLFLVGALAVAATLANPYGWRMWQFLGDTVGFGRAEITDWQPLYRLGPGYVALWVVLTLAAAAGVARAWRSGEWELRRLVVVALLCVASFQVSRLLAFFAIATVLLLGRDVALVLQSWRGASRREGGEPGRFAAIAAMTIAAALMIGGGAAVARSVACVRMGADQPEPDVATIVKERKLTGRLAVWFDWGEYAIWHFAPALTVSIDGRRETVYSNDVMQKHLSFYYVPSTMNQFLSEVRPDHIWAAAAPARRAQAAGGGMGAARHRPTVRVADAARRRAAGAGRAVDTVSGGHRHPMFPGSVRIWRQVPRLGSKHTSSISFPSGS